MNMRKIYQACIASRMLYTCSLWYSLDERFGTVGLENAVLKTLISIQRRAAQTIAETFWNISGSALNVKLHLLPIKFRLERALGETLICLKTGRSNPFY